MNNVCVALFPEVSDNWLVPANGQRQNAFELVEWINRQLRLLCCKVVEICSRSCFWLQLVSADFSQKVWATRSFVLENDISRINASYNIELWTLAAIAKSFRPALNIVKESFRACNGGEGDPKNCFRGVLGHGQEASPHKLACRSRYVSPFLNYWPLRRSSPWRSCRVDNHIMHHPSLYAPH